MLPVAPRSRRPALQKTPDAPHLVLVILWYEGSMDTRPEILNPTAAKPSLGEPGELPKGTVVDRFIVHETLGAGGMGVVYSAYDPELGRKVALKLLLPRAGGSGDGDRTRLVREGQALAKLSHPNVVAVHDVGVHDDRVWIAMEFVAGQTLAAWAKERPRRWTEVLAMLVDVARGIAAAHGAGLVHRDLKPENVMIDRECRVRVMDFGLAHGRSGVSMTEVDLASTLVSGTNTLPELTPLGLRLTAEGAVQGTPAYMAPEQWQGQAEAASTDQFGWSVMAWELLYGERPFAGGTKVALARAVLAGQRRPPPNGRGVPGWLRRVLERGLSTQPAGRWPTMVALLSALERGKTQARVRTGVTALAGVALLGAGVVGYQRWDTAQRVSVCETRGAEIDRAWNDDARQQLRRAFAATGTSYAATSAEKVIPWLDKQAVAWKEARTEVCMNADVSEVWDEELVYRAMWCLEDRQLELESLVAELSRANGTIAQKAVTAASGLRTVKSCLDEGILRRQPTPPLRDREAIRDVRTLLSQAESLSLAGNYKEALAVATHARGQASKLDWLPLLAFARAREGSLLENLGAYVKAEAASAQAYFEAARAGAWDVAAWAAVDLVYTTGMRRARYLEGRTWAQHAEVAIVHAGDQGGLREAQRLNNLATINSATGAYVEARALDERALTIREHALGPEHPAVAGSLNNLAVVHAAAGRYPEARTLFERALAIQEQALGPGHPAVANALNNLANVHKAIGSYAAARALHERALAVRVQALGPEHPVVAQSLNNLAEVLIETGAYAEARALLVRGLAIKERALGPDHPGIVATLNNLANAYFRTGLYAEAKAMHERALNITQQALGPVHPDVAKGLANLASVHYATGAYADARKLYERALAIQEQVLSSDHSDIAMSLQNLAEICLAENRPGDAISLLERAIVIYGAHEGEQQGEMAAHFSFARALVAAGGDGERAFDEARKARDGFREAGASKAKEFAEVEQWLAEHDHAQ